MTHALPNILGLELGEIQTIVSELGGTPQQARNLMRAVHQQRPPTLGEIAGVTRRLLEKLPDRVRMERLKLKECQHSGGSNSTRKLLLETHDQLPLEAVLFSTHGDASRFTLCLSSQAGCRMACTFCATGAMGFYRHLGADEIVAQVWEAIAFLGAGEILNNVVFMGMGEPLENFGPVSAAIRILHHELGFQLAYDKITVSTCGVLPGIQQLAAELPRVNLALSLHATRDTVRTELVPINRRYPIASLMEALRQYPRKGCKVFCIEYCLLAGVNDSPEEGEELARLMQGIRHKIHLIPYNPVPGLPYQRPDDASIKRFARAVHAAGASVLVRDSRGQDILAACGQLGAAHIGQRLRTATVRVIPSAACS